MNLNERMDRVERSLEIVAQFQASHEANLDRLFELFAKQESRVDTHASRLDRILDVQEGLARSQAKNEITLAQLMESVNSLARIAHAHEQRISNLEDPQ